MKAQELKTKTSTQTLIYKISLQRYQVYQGKLLASFQDDAKYENVGQYTRSTATTPIESNKPLVKDEYGVDVDVHVYRSMIGSLMYLTASRPDIMFTVCACARFQVTPKPFELKAYSDSDYGGASLDRKSTTRGCQFLGRRLIYWQCKKHTIMANSTTKHIMVAYLEKTDGNTKFHQIMDFLTLSSIYDALTSAPSPRPSPSIAVPDPKGSGGNHGGQSSNDVSLLGNEDGLTLQSVKKLKKEVKPLITHHKAWKKTRLARKTSLKKKGVHTEYVSKQGRKSVKSFKGEPFVHKDLAFDDLDDFVDVDDTLDYMESEDAQDEGRTSSVGLKEKESTNSTKVSTDREGKGTADQNEWKCITQIAPTSTSTSTPTTPTPTVFGDDETIAQVLIIMSQNKEKLKEKEKRVDIRNIEDTKRPRPTSTRSILTLRPLPKIDPKDKGKRRIEEEDESDTESEGITEAKKKFKQLANDEEVARKARINADKILAEELQKEEREKFTIEQREKFLHDTIAAKRKFLAQQRSEAIRNKPPTGNRLRNQMMTYLKHVGRKKHSKLKTKTFEEIQVLYERLKRQDQNFVAIGSAEDERQTKEMNEESKYPEKKRLKKRVVNEEDTAKVLAKQEATEHGTKKRKSGHVKMIARKRPRPQPDDEHRKCLRITTFESTIDSEIMETKSFIARLHKVSSPDGNYLVIYKVNGHFRAFNYLMEGDLKIMMESSTEENDQELKDRTVIYMLVERRYPLSKKLMQRMLDLGLEVEEESIVALQLLATPEKMDTGKEISNLLIADSLLKTIRSIHLVVYNEELAIPEQTATGKGISNPLMAGSLPKTTKPT
ncbi:hypothetical protein Tco_0365305 [Tanacetum coccineum]